jgi:hypothetical protein
VNSARYDFPVEGLAQPRLIPSDLGIADPMATIPSVDSRVAESDTDARACESAVADSAKTDLWIFRDGRRKTSGSGMLSKLICFLKSSGPGSLTDALIQAGELECGLADLGHPGAGAASQLTDALAERLCGGTSRDLLQLAKRIKLPESISIAPPEGFTYYALHPLDFSRLAERLPAGHASWAVIGIRSIGTTVSATTAAALRISGRSAQRITVRPEGHPYDRCLSFDQTQLQWVRKQLQVSAQFLIVDEGPGRSGSTFLSVAEELGRAGVPAENITIAGSRSLDAASLCAHNAATRWQKFRFLATIPSVNSRFKDCSYVGGGEWRAVFCEDEGSWPASWIQMERLKFLSSDRSTLFKFEGMGRVGAQVRERAAALSRAGLGPRAEEAGDGFLAYSVMPGAMLSRLNLCRSLLDHIAKYCAFRLANFSCQGSVHAELPHMLAHNLEQEFGWTSPLDTEHLLTARPALADGAMHPCEWILAANGRIIKTDGISHGDNHFFPGPCDIAWDLAGTAVEWELKADAIEYLVRQFQRHSGVEVSKRLPAHILAYCVFRLGFCKMGLSTARGSKEEGRLYSAYRKYRNHAAELLRVAAGSRIQDLLDCRTGFAAARLHRLQD